MEEHTGSPLAPGQSALLAQRELGAVAAEPGYALEQPSAEAPAPSAEQPVAEASAADGCMPRPRRTIKLGFGPVREWLKEQLQADACALEGLAALPLPSLPFPAAVALRELLAALNPGYDMPTEHEADQDEGSSQDKAAVGEVAQSRISLLDSLRQSDPETYNQLLAAAEAEKAAVSQGTTVAAEAQ
ncbi:histidine--tRNA ligase [Chlorella sorokiniana]|uniref:Histidine--tRNA ligase n=1 Tax=Chlorella sorokiniana TaxID=3076 RepID=A0A2P6TFP6_CHLSO|nr:histidine--tRNA ligase [Chlorella sorokiniana]|eukprot:PRW32933.1 histidine--tRNA ligase [Chlorella sorokiniana]